MVVLINQDVDLHGKRVRRQGGSWHPKSYPFQIPVDHPLAVYVSQPTSDFLEL
jgi:hypothetical protein